MIKLLPRPDRESDSEADDIEHAEKLRQVKAVLEEVHSNISFYFEFQILYICYFCL